MRRAANWGSLSESHYFAVGTVVPWAEAGVGAIAVQFIPDSRYGTLGLDLMRAGKSASGGTEVLVGGGRGA